MRAIISDVHGNLEALQAVLRDIEQQGADEIYCLGDIIDYGPNPRECVDLLMGCKVVLMGDRDHAVLYDEGGEFGTDGYQSALWTRNELESLFLAEDVRKRRWDFLAGCPRSHEEGDFLYVHGAPGDPLFGCVTPLDIYTERKMAGVFGSLDRYCFHGHTHVPGIIAEPSEYVSPEDVGSLYRLDSRKTLCNVGSVGQPCDDWRACYALFDGDTVHFRRVEYDIEITRRKLDSIPDLPNFLREVSETGFTEYHWLNHTEPAPLLDFLHGKGKDRKLRLFACACCHRVEALLTDERSTKGISTLERFLDDGLPEHEIEVVHMATRQAARVATGPAARLAAEAAAATVAPTLIVRNVARAASQAVASVSGLLSDAQWAASDRERRAQANLLRHIVGNPFRPYAAPASWPAAVVQLAEAQNAGADCAFALHDALLDAGHPDLAAHFREPTHPKGCWVVDLILGKS